MPQDAALRSRHGDGFLDEDVFSEFESEARVLVVVAVGRGDVDDVYVFVLHEFGVGSVYFCGAGGADAGQEVAGAG